MSNDSTRPIRTAVAGFGLSGSVFHAPFIAANPAFSLDAISTSDAGRQVCRRRAVTRRPGSSTPRPTSWSSPASWTCWCSARRRPPTTRSRRPRWKPGLDVVVDKPFAVRSAEGQELIDLAARLGRVLTVFQNRRWDGDFLTVKALLDSGALGTVTRFESRFERWSPEVAKAWKAAATADDGGGVLFDLGTHLLDQAVQLFGPATVTHAELAARRPGEKADDDVFVALRHESGVTSHLWMNMLCAQQGPRYRHPGQRGRLHQARRGPAGALHRGRRQPAGRRLRRRGPGLGRAARAATGTWTGCPPNAAPTRSSTGSWRTRSPTAAQPRRCPSRSTRRARSRCCG